MCLWCHVCVCAGVSAHVFECTWRSEVDIDCLLCSRFDILFLRQGFSVNLELTVQLDSANFRSVLAPSSLLFSHTGIIDISTVCSFYIGVEDLNTWQALYQLSHLPSCTSNYALCISFWHLGYQPVLYSWAVCMCVCVFMCPIGLKSARHDLLRFGSWQNSIHYSWLVCMR